MLGLTSPVLILLTILILEFLCGWIFMEYSKNSDAIPK